MKVFISPRVSTILLSTGNNHPPDCERFHLRPPDAREFLRQPEQLVTLPTTRTSALLDHHVDVNVFTLINAIPHRVTSRSCSCSCRSVLPAIEPVLREWWQYLNCWWVTRFPVW